MLDYVTKISKQLLLRSTFSGNLSTLKIKIYLSTLSYGTQHPPPTPTCD